MSIPCGRSVRRLIGPFAAQPQPKKARPLWLWGVLVGTLSACMAGSAPAPEARSAQASLPVAAAMGAQDECSPRSFLPVYPEDRPDPFATWVSVLSVLMDRLTAVQSAMQTIRDASDLAAVRCGSQATLDLLLGSRGRNRSPSVLFPGVLPADTPALLDPGLALTAHETSADPRVRQAMAGVLLGDVGGWLQGPSQRWDEIDRAVASWTPGNDTVSSLDGVGMRLIGWARLALQAPTMGAASQIGSLGLRDAAAGLEATRDALIAICEEVADALCEYGI